MRRFSRTMLALLPLGLLLSAALAVLSGMKVDSASLRVVASGFSYLDQPVEHGWYVQVQRAFGKRHAITHRASERFATTYSEQRRAEQVAPSWMNRAFPDRPLYDGDRLRRIAVACGWPAPMIRGEVELDSNAVIIQTNHFLPTASRNGALPVYGYQLRGVPTQPIWWGIAINSIFYALLISVMITIVRWMRLAWRRHHNVCTRCRYDLRGGHATCPECGTPTGC